MLFDEIKLIGTKFLISTLPKINLRLSQNQQTYQII